MKFIKVLLLNSSSFYKNGSDDVANSRSTCYLNVDLIKTVERNKDKFTVTFHGSDEEYIFKGYDLKVLQKHNKLGNGSTSASVVLPLELSFPDELSFEDSFSTVDVDVSKLELIVSCTNYVGLKVQGSSNYIRVSESPLGLIRKIRSSVTPSDKFPLFFRSDDGESRVSVALQRVSDHVDGGEFVDLGFKGSTSRVYLKSRGGTLQSLLEDYKSKKHYNFARDYLTLRETDGSVYRLNLFSIDVVYESGQTSMVKLANSDKLLSLDISYDELLQNLAYYYA